MIHASEQEMSQSLNSLDIRALRDADSVVFRHSEAGQPVIECIRRLAKPTPWETESRYCINVTSRIHQNFSRGVARSVKRTKAVHIEMHAQYNEKWKTIVGSLKAGDVLGLDWRMDCHTNGYLEKAGLHGDVLELVAMREGSKNTKKLLWEAGSSVCAENSARMIHL